MKHFMMAATAALALHTPFVMNGAEANTGNEPAHPLSTTSDDSMFPLCIDISGDRAEYFSKDEIDIRPSVAYAGARYRDAENQSGPLIIYDQSFIDGLTDVQRDFSFAHECAHLSTGDAVVAYQNYLADRSFGRKDMQDMEDRADCLAVYRMRDEFGYNAEHMREVYDLILDVERAGAAQARWDKIVHCYGEDIPVL